MKKKFLAAAILLLVLLSGGAACAHPPKTPDIVWDRTSETLTVTAEHNVNDPAKHYILTLTVFEGNRQLLLKQYDKQGSPERFSDSVILKGLKPGAQVRVQLVCNIMGSVEGEIKIP